MKRVARAVLMTGMTTVFRVLNVAARLFQFSKLARIIRQASWKAELADCGEETVIYPTVVIHASKQVSIGARCVIAEFVHMWGGGGITIGDDVIIASHVVITSQTHDKQGQCYRETTFRAKVVIGDNVWIGAGAIILPGVILGPGSIIGAGAVVTRDVSAGNIVVGVPARVSEKHEYDRTSMGKYDTKNPHILTS